MWDVGAHQGYSTLVAASRTGSAGRVIAFEPSAYNLWYLERHLKWNGCGNVVVVPAAVSGVDRRARFGGTGSSVSFRLEGGTEIVTVRSGDSLLREGLPRPTFLKVDIEGTEAEMLHGATAVLETVELLTVAIHSRDLYESCVALLQDQGFEVHQDVRMRRFLADPPCRWDRDPDLVAVRPHLSERRERVARLGGLELVPGPPQ